MVVKKNIILVISLALLIHLAFNALAEDSIEYSPYPKRDYPTRVYFGDTHHHTANSGDAFMNGDRLSPEDAYRFAGGEEVVSSTADGQLPAVGSTVDLKTAKYTNSIGAATLMSSWMDRNFNPEQHASYYARVQEIPTPRWSTYDAVNNNLPLLEDVASTIQERAWSSPIWYKP